MRKSIKEKFLDQFSRMPEAEQAAVLEEMIRGHSLALPLVVGRSYSDDDPYVVTDFEILRVCFSEETANEALNAVKAEGYGRVKIKGESWGWQF